jgi:hypothetical protein
MKPEAFVLREAGVGGDLPEEWQALAAEAERELTAQAQGHVRLERELVELRALVMDFSTRPSALTARVRTLESALEVLHANLATARQYLAALFHQEP